MVNACADPDFFVRGGGGGGGVQAQRRENSLDFGFFLVQNFPVMRGGVQLFTRGGGPNANFYRL